MLNNYIANFMIEFFIFCGILLWFIGGCTIFIPFFYDLADGDYWDISSFVDNMRLGKVNTNKKK